MIKKIASLLFISSILLFTCCGGSAEPEDDSGVSCNINAKDCKAVISFTLLADSNLKEDTKIAIMGALAEWDIRTGEHINYTVTFKDMSKESIEPNNYENIFKLLVKEPGTGLLGWTSWYSEKNSALILIKPGMDSKTFKTVLLHELGHALDLHFGNDIHYTGDKKSIMHPAIGNTDKLECPELLAFCDKYKCQVDCEYVPANSVHLQSWKPLENICETTSVDLTAN